MGETVQKLSQQIKEIKASIKVLEASKTNVTDAEELKKINKEINALQASIKPLKKEIEYEKCLNAEFAAAAQ